MPDFAALSTFDDEAKAFNVIIETPKGQRNKFTWDEAGQFFRLSKVLPAGSVFPFDFGFLPQTKGEDGDPLDILVLMDERAFAGCVISARLIGVIEAEQRERDGKTQRNDRLLAVSDCSPTHASVKSISNLDEVLLEQIEHFFVSYNAIAGKQFTPLTRSGVSRARQLIDEGRKRVAEK